MTLQITGKSIDAGEAYKTYIADKLASVLEKYIGRELSGHVRLEKERGRFRTDCSIRLRTGLVLEAHGEGADAYASADAAAERLETRVRRYKRRLKSHHNGRHEPSLATETKARDSIVEIGADDAVEENADHPIIIAETERGIRELRVSEAVMQLDLSDAACLVFRNAAHGGFNVVYRRPDGNIGWIDPEQGDSPRAGKDELPH